MMKIELLGALNYDKLSILLKEHNINDDEIEVLVEEIKDLEKYQRCNIVSAAGKLSRHLGDVFDLLEVNEQNSFEKNKRVIERITGMGHDSILDHDYLVFAIKDVSPVVEQTIIEERFSSFTIKSRREVDFSKVGFYTPDFRDQDGNFIDRECNLELRNEYKEHMNSLFGEYANLTEKGVSKEDARFVLPYSYHSNIVMGVDLHTLRDMIIKLTKGKDANIQELNEFGTKLYNIALENCPQIIAEIDKQEYKCEDAVSRFLESSLYDFKKLNYKIAEKPILLNRTENVDDTILVSAIMRRYQVSQEQAKDMLRHLTIKNDNFKEDLMRKIIFEGDGIELKQVNFQYQIPLSFAVLTHLTRHRTHPIMVPDFVPNIDLLQYKVPPKIKALGLEEEFASVYQNNYEKYVRFLESYGICEEDLVYFTLSGNMVNCITNFDGKTLEHILALRECSKAQWETRDMAYGIHECLKDEDIKIFSSLIGAPCETKRFCKEGKESCGKILALQKQDEALKDN